MELEYTYCELYDGIFCRRLPRRGRPLYHGTTDMDESLIEGMEDYSQSERSNAICDSPTLSGRYLFDSDHTGCDILYTLIEIVNDRIEFEVGNYFYFHMLVEVGTASDFVLLANPTETQPGNGVIVTSAIDCQPKSWDALMELLPTHKESAKFSLFFKQFMKSSIATAGPGHYFETAVLLLFEIARRLVSDELLCNEQKKSLDSIPVASCIAMCLGPRINDIRLCRDVFGHKHDRDFELKVLNRKDAVEKILRRNKGDKKYHQLRGELFYPNSDDSFLKRLANLHI